MRYTSLLWIFNTKVEPPSEIGLVTAVLIRWAVVTGLILAMSILAAAVVAFFADDSSKAVELMYYTRSIFLILFACWCAYSTYANIANRNRRKHEELTAMYREIAAYYHEKRIQEGNGVRESGDE